MSERNARTISRIRSWSECAFKALARSTCEEDCDNVSAVLHSILQSVAFETKVALLDSEKNTEVVSQILAVLRNVMLHLHARSTTLTCAQDFDYWDYMCALLSYTLDLKLNCHRKALLLEMCFYTCSDKHRVWDVIVQSAAIGSKAVVTQMPPVIERLVAWCTKRCADPCLYFKFVVTVAIVMKQCSVDNAEWKSLKRAIRTVEPQFDFPGWFSLQKFADRVPVDKRATKKKLVNYLCKGQLNQKDLLAMCSTLPGSTPRCLVQGLVEEDMFVIEEQEKETTSLIETEELQLALDRTLTKLSRTSGNAETTDNMIDSEIISDSSNPAVDPEVFLRKFLNHGSTKPADGDTPKKQIRKRSRKGSTTSPLKSVAAELSSSSEEPEVQAQQQRTCTPKKKSPSERTCPSRPDSAVLSPLHENSSSKVVAEPPHAFAEKTGNKNADTCSIDVGGLSSLESGCTKKETPETSLSRVMLTDDASRPPADSATSANVHQTCRKSIVISSDDCRSEPESKFDDDVKTESFDDSPVNKTRLKQKPNYKLVTTSSDEVESEAETVGMLSNGSAVAEDANSGTDSASPQVIVGNAQTGMNKSGTDSLVHDVEEEAGQSLSDSDDIVARIGSNGTHRQQHRKSRIIIDSEEDCAEASSDEEHSSLPKRGASAASTTNSNTSDQSFYEIIVPDTQESALSSRDDGSTLSKISERSQSTSTHELMIPESQECCTAAKSIPINMLEAESKTAESKPSSQLNGSLHGLTQLPSSESNRNCDMFDTDDSTLPLPFTPPTDLSAAALATLQSEESTSRQMRPRSSRKSAIKARGKFVSTADPDLESSPERVLARRRRIIVSDEDSDTDPDFRLSGGKVSNPAKSLQCKYGPLFPASCSQDRQASGTSVSGERAGSQDPPLTRRSLPPAEPQMSNNYARAESATSVSSSPAAQGEIDLWKTNAQVNGTLATQKKWAVNTTATSRKSMLSLGKGILKREPVSVNSDSDLETESVLTQTARKGKMALQDEYHLCNDLPHVQTCPKEIKPAQEAQKESRNQFANDEKIGGRESPSKQRERPMPLQKLQLKTSPPFRQPSPSGDDTNIIEGSQNLGKQSRLSLAGGRILRSRSRGKEKLPSTASFGKGDVLTSTPKDSTSLATSRSKLEDLTPKTRDCQGRLENLSLCDIMELAENRSTSSPSTPGKNVMSKQSIKGSPPEKKVHARNVTAGAAHEQEAGKQTFAAKSIDQNEYSQKCSNTAGVEGPDTQTHAGKSLDRNESSAECMDASVVGSPLKELRISIPNLKTVKGKSTTTQTPVPTDSQENTCSVCSGHSKAPRTRERGTMTDPACENASDETVPHVSPGKRPRVAVRQTSTGKRGRGMPSKRSSVERTETPPQPRSSPRLKSRYNLRKSLTVPRRLHY